MSKSISIDDRLTKVPDYTRFLTVDELYERARTLAEKHPEIAKLTIVGKSTAGSEIPMVSIGNGPASILVFACPHPNEPIGAMTTCFLMDELVADDDLRSGRTWHIMPCVDPDGARLNEGWFAGPFNIRNYARNFYRPRPQDQVEWSFPIEYKTLKWTDPKPETQGLMKAIEQAKPALMYSLHNAGFGGAYYYITSELEKEHYDVLHRIPVERGIALSLGEPEVPWASAFYPGVYRMCPITDAYDYYEKYAPGDPAQYTVGGCDSSQWAEKISDPFSLVTEVPYFMSAKISDQTELDRPRRDVIMEGVARSRQVYEVMTGALRATEGMITDPTGRLLRDAVATFVESGVKSLATQERWAKETPGMEKPATVAQEVDSVHVGVFYKMLIAGMLARAVDQELAAMSAGTDGGAGDCECSCGCGCSGSGSGSGGDGTSKRARLQHTVDELRAAIDGWATTIEENLPYEVVPIKNLVEVQYGALLVALQAKGL